MGRASAFCDQCLVSFHYHRHTDQLSCFISVISRWFTKRVIRKSQVKDGDKYAFRRHEDILVFHSFLLSRSPPPPTMSTTGELEDALDVDSSWLPRPSHTLWSLFPFQSPEVNSEDETDTDVLPAESKNDLDIEPAELQVRGSLWEPFLSSQTTLTIFLFRGSRNSKSRANSPMTRIRAPWPSKSYKN